MQLMKRRLSDDGSGNAEGGCVSRLPNLLIEIGYVHMRIGVEVGGRPRGDRTKPVCPPDILIFAEKVSVQDLQRTV